MPTYGMHSTQTFLEKSNKINKMKLPVSSGIVTKIENIKTDLTKILKPTHSFGLERY